jgi:LPXTG-motif cell wall-anchored protein
VGETLTVTYTQAISDAFGTELTNTATVVDRHSNENDTSTATTRVVADPPNAVNDEDLNNAIGEAVPVSVLTNDTGTIVPSSLTFFDPTTNTALAGPLVVPGEGTWTIGTGQITFTPEVGFKGDPTPVTYRITDTNGQTDTATVTVTYVPTAANDEDLDNTIGDSVAVSVLNNDIGDFDTDTLRILDGTTPVTTLLVAGQGTWTVEADGIIRFTPAEGFNGDPTPITYQVEDTTGDAIKATVTVTYLPIAANDASTGNKEGSPVTVDVIGNDAGTFDPTSVRVIDPKTGELTTSLVVAGEGTWTVNPGTGAITFTPEPGYTGDPTPIRYQVTDLDGDITTAGVTVTYVHPGVPTPSASAPAAPLANTGSLATTGTEASSVIGFAALAFLLGGAGIYAARRQRVQK